MSNNIIVHTIHNGIPERLNLYSTPLGQVEREAGLACEEMCWEMEFWDEVCDSHKIVESVEPVEN